MTEFGIAKENMFEFWDVCTFVVLCVPRVMCIIFTSGLEAAILFGLQSAYQLLWLLVSYNLCLYVHVVCMCVCVRVCVCVCVLAHMCTHLRTCMLEVQLVW